jgi:predicted acyl esterase
LYERVALAWPDSVAVIYRLGQILLLTGDPEASLERFHVARARQYRVTSALYNIAIARSRLGRLTEAFATLDEDLDILRSDRRWRPFISRVWGTSRDSTLSAPVQRLELRRNVAIPVRDGAVLRADIAVPRDESGPFPTVLIRTPYGRFLQFANRIHWAARGYVLVAQDVRGRGNSTGEFDPWMNEDSDGYDTIEWIVQQPWSDGRVGMIGASYGAQVQWLAAAAGHPALRAMISIMSGTDPFFDTPWDHGVLKMGLLDWLYSMTHPNAPVGISIASSLAWTSRSGIVGSSAIRRTPGSARRFLTA